jgi:hypothetical protein
MHMTDASVLLDDRSELDEALTDDRDAGPDPDREPAISESELAEACMLSFDCSDWTVPRTCQALEMAYRRVC